MLRQIRDISHHNTIQNYAAFRVANHGVQIKITESTSFIDDAAWITKTGTRGRHYIGCAGMPRAPYHFARPVSLPQQIAHFLRVKKLCGAWERMDMLDCEFEGITGAFIKALVAEYRRQSGNVWVQVYVGLHDFLHACRPELWWDERIAIQVARYRKIGPPVSDQWAGHLGTDHRGITTYQWDNSWPFYPGSPTAGDISFDRVLLGSEGEDDMPSAEEVADLVIQKLVQLQVEHPHVVDPDTGRGKLISFKDAVLLGNDAAQRAELALVKDDQSNDQPSVRSRLGAIEDNLTTLVASTGTSTVTLVPEGSITLTRKESE